MVEKILKRKEKEEESLIEKLNQMKIAPNKYKQVDSDVVISLDSARFLADHEASLSNQQSLLSHYDWHYFPHHLTILSHATHLNSI